MDVREKLMELQSIITCPNAICNFCEHFKNKSACERHKKEVIADNMIANGVTVQEWIPVEDELPEVGGYVVCIAKRNPFSRFMPMVARIEKNGWVNPMTEQYISEVTHWMPLPEPPEEDDKNE